MCISQCYTPIIPHLLSILERTKSKKIVDMCSGAGGPWLGIKKTLEQKLNSPVSLCLTDKYPNLTLFQHTKTKKQQKIDYYKNSVDATQLPSELKGMRTLFSSFHHFHPEEASSILKDAVKHKQGIGIFEITQRNLFSILMVCLMPLAVLVVTPFLRPFSWSRLVLTYLIPVIPFLVFFDGFVSCLRSYTLDELRKMTKEFSEEGYQWEIGEKRGKFLPIPVTYLIGYPIDS